MLIHKVQGKVPAFIPELTHRQLVPLHLFILEDGGLDGQAMGVPSGHIGGAVARHVPVPHDHVLENFVQGGADVDVAVGVGRAVVQHKFGLAGVLLHELLIDAGLLKGLQHGRLPLGQARAHGEVGAGEIDGFVVVLRHGV
ncbi:hypothetical protein SDC9_167318 [bioreactor metagenome]|uniref:Uncharacterized protein n=1 Tax=bioreactor metagenome TaxID=1076179 RepID=A0A645G7P0_9ZZZZ